MKRNSFLRTKGLPAFHSNVAALLHFQRFGQHNRTGGGTDTGGGTGGGTGTGGGNPCGKLIQPEIEIDLRLVKQIVIYDLAGKIMYQGSKAELNSLKRYKHSLLLVSYFDNLGNKLGTKKHFSKSL